MFGTPSACAGITGGETHTYTVTTQKPDDTVLLLLRTDPNASVSAHATLATAGGEAVPCSNSATGPLQCTTGAAGAYTLKVSADWGASSYSIAVDSRLSGTCTDLPATAFSFAEPVRSGHLAQGSTGDCYRFDLPTGTVLRVTGASQGASPGQVWAAVGDRDGAQVCLVPSYSTNLCTLTGSGPYTVRYFELYAGEAQYNLQLIRLSDAQGCPELKTAVFGDTDPAHADGSVPQYGAGCHTVTAAAGLLGVRVVNKDDNGNPPFVHWTLYDNVANQVCTGYESLTRCSVATAGSYHLVVEPSGYDNPTLYQAAVFDLAATTGCADQVDTGFDRPTVTGSIRSRLQIDCRPFRAQPGERIIGENSWNSITDATGKAVCVRDYSQDGCVLPGSGPYRMLTTGMNGATGDYALQIRRLNDPVGCPAEGSQAFGTAATASDVRCRTLDAAAAGQYLLHAADNAQVTVYQQDGTRLCQWGPVCDIPAAGSYTALFGAPTDPYTAVSKLVFHAPGETRGCVPGNDAGLTGARTEGDLTGEGQLNCHTLPSPKGAGLALLAPAGDSLINPPTQTIVDAAGVQQCQTAYATAFCSLTGTAPFRQLVSADSTGHYAITVARTDSPSGCAAFPADRYDGKPGTAVKLTATAPVRCLAIPANGHAAAEQLDYDYNPKPAKAPQVLPGEFHVYDPAGKQVCQSYAFNSSTTTCTFEVGKAYTALLVGNGTEHDFEVVRRDITATAPCAAVTSTAVGGTPLQGRLDSALAANCARIQAAAGDRLRISTGNSTGKVLLVVTDATGRTLCSAVNGECLVSGSTGYQAVLTAYDYTGTALEYRLDAWRLATTDGFPAECLRIPAVATGFGPLTGTLTRDRAAVCATVPVKPYDQFRIGGAYAPQGTAVPKAHLYGRDGVDYCIDTQGTDGFYTDCNVPYGAGPTALLLLSLRPGDTSVDYRVTAACTRGTCGPAVPADGTGAAFTPLQPTRLLDTRSGLGRSGTAPVAGGQTVDLQVTGRGGVPAAGAESVVLNITATTPTAVGYLTAWPTGVARPTASSLNWAAGRTVPNLVTVPVGADGRVSLYVGSPGSAHLVADVLGYYATAVPGAAFTPVGPERLLDTRNGTGRPGTSTVAAGETVRLQVAGRGGVPASGATAVALTVTVTNTSSVGYLTAWPSGTARPLASNLNWAAGQTTANSVVVPIGADGAVSLFDSGPGSLHLVADVAGYYSGSAAGALYRSAGPVRLIDTRQAPQSAPVAAQGVLQLDLTGTPAAGAKAVVLNVTVADPASNGYLTAWPSGAARPTASNLNWVKGQVVANQVVVPVGADGRVSLFNGSWGPVHVIVDRVGYFG
ncbi:hypothetical protein [Kitasatospora sp. NPDC059571]|uniref:hypothetical protein n=1 Tax=Kitasatospora sp. NPDC059571 TaxID=3346871 RepID=UPI0036CF283C